MISVLLYSYEKRELVLLDKVGKEIVCRMSEDDWDFFSFSEKKQILNFLRNNPIIDISCVDVADKDGIALAEQLRMSNKKMYLILLTDTGVSPILYIKPTIMASSLLMRPLSAELIKKVFVEAVSIYIKNFDNDDGDYFVIDNREGRQLVPFNRIIYFESREKKIFINTGAKEYSFYDTLDNLEQKLPDGFVRCHRSYIVSKKNIKKIMFSLNEIELYDDYSIPLSRSYKSLFKEWK